MTGAPDPSADRRRSPAAARRSPAGWRAGGVTGAIYVHFNLSQFAGVVHLLREERPVYLYEFGPSNAGLMTGGEPTGEEEGLSG